jgi:thiamine phosphate synthase YjbQ (UPF0047 family)
VISRLSIQTPGQGLHMVTGEIEAVVREAGVREGLCTVIVQHTSASLSTPRRA